MRRIRPGPDFVGYRLLLLPAVRVARTTYNREPKAHRDRHPYTWVPLKRKERPLRSRYMLFGHGGWCAPEVSEAMRQSCPPTPRLSPRVLGSIYPRQLGSCVPGWCVSDYPATARRRFQGRSPFLRPPSDGMRREMIISQTNRHRPAHTQEGVCCLFVVLYSAKNSKNNTSFYIIKKINKLDASFCQ